MGIASRYNENRPAARPAPVEVASGQPRPVDMGWEFSYGDWLADPRKPTLTCEHPSLGIFSLFASKPAMEAAVARGEVCLSPLEALAVFAAPEGDYTTILRVKKVFPAARVLEVVEPEKASASIPMPAPVDDEVEDA